MRRIIRAILVVAATAATFGVTYVLVFVLPAWVVTLIE